MDASKYRHSIHFACNIFNSLYPIIYYSVAVNLPTVLPTMPPAPPALVSSYCCMVWSKTVTLIRMSSYASYRYIPDLSSCISQNDSIVQFDIVDPGGLAGIVVFLVVLIVVSVVMVVLVVFGVYKYRTRSNKSSVDSEYDLTTEMMDDVIDHI